MSIIDPKNRSYYINVWSDALGFKRLIEEENLEREFRKNEDEKLDKLIRLTELLTEKIDNNIVWVDNHKELKEVLTDLLKHPSFKDVDIKKEASFLIESINALNKIVPWECRFADKKAKQQIK